MSWRPGAAAPAPLPDDEVVDGVTLGATVPSGASLGLTAAGELAKADGGVWVEIEPDEVVEELTISDLAESAPAGARIGYGFDGRRFWVDSDGNWATGQFTSPVLVYRQDLDIGVGGNANLFATLAEANDTSAVGDPAQSPKFSALDRVESFRRSDGRLYFRLVYPASGSQTGADVVFEWSQTSNPFVNGDNPAADTVEGFVPTNVATGAFEGLASGGGGAWFNGNANDSDWWQAIAARTRFGSMGFPVIEAGTIEASLAELWVIPEPEVVEVVEGLDDTDIGTAAPSGAKLGTTLGGRVLRVDGAGNWAQLINPGYGLADTDRKVGEFRPTDPAPIAASSALGTFFSTGVDMSAPGTKLVISVHDNNLNNIYWQSEVVDLAGVRTFAPVANNASSPSFSVNVYDNDYLRGWLPATLDGDITLGWVGRNFRLVAIEVYAPAQMSARVGEFIYAKTSPRRSPANGYLPVIGGIVNARINGALEFPVWAAEYPEFVVGDDIIFPDDVDGMFLRNLGGNAGGEGVFQSDEFKSHTHPYIDTNHHQFTNKGTGGNVARRGSQNTNRTTTATGGDETRPVNRAYQLFAIVDTYVG